MAMVTKHLKPQMDLAGDYRMMWLFQDWVEDTPLPKYRFEYSLKDEVDGKCRLTGTLTQSNVTGSFRMMVPLYADFDARVSQGSGSCSSRGIRRSTNKKTGG